MDKKKVCPECQNVCHGVNFCDECGKNIIDVEAREVCWIVLRATATGFSVIKEQYESLEDLQSKAGPNSKLVENWLVLVFVDEIKVGNTLTSLQQYFVTRDRNLRESTQKTYLLTE